jgi:hypothetical protein
MDNPISTPPLSEEQAREIINRWGAGGFFRLRNMGDKIFFRQVRPGAAYTIRLQTHYERRKVERVSEPYSGGRVDDRGEPPGPWEVPVPQPGEFKERTRTVPVPHTERVERCGQCAGEGQVTCPGCAGQGRTTCKWCGGSGSIQVPVLEPGQGGQGGSMRVATKRCMNCSGGIVRCGGCSGTGIQRCDESAGHGQVKTFNLLVVRFQTAKQGELLDVTPVPDAWLGKLSGDLLVERKERRVAHCPPDVPPEVVKKADDLLAKSHAVDEARARILLQLLHVERIPLYEVSYTYAGTDRTLWICGREQALHAPGAPWHRKRLFAVIAGATAVTVAVVAALVYFFVIR